MYEDILLRKKSNPLHNNTIYSDKNKDVFCKKMKYFETGLKSFIKYHNIYIQTAKICVKITK